jgi:transposase-like protein
MRRGISHLCEMPDVDVSPDLISRVTDSVLEDLVAELSATTTSRPAGSSSENLQQSEDGPCDGVTIGCDPS